MALVDGDNGMGHLVMTRAAEIAIEKARRPASPGSGAHEQPRRAGLALRAHAARARHDRPLLRGGQRQPPAAVGRARHAALHQPDRGRDSRGRGAAGRARHGDDGRGVRQGEDQGAARRDDAGRLDDGSRGQAAHRSAARRRGLPAADRRLQGLRPCARRRASRRHAERCRDGQGRDGFQRRRRSAHQHRPGDRRHRPRGVRRSRPSSRRRVDTLIRDLRGSERMPGVERIWLPGEQSHVKRIANERDGDSHRPGAAREPRPARRRARHRTSRSATDETGRIHDPVPAALAVALCASASRRPRRTIRTGRSRSSFRSPPRARSTTRRASSPQRCRENMGQQVVVENLPGRRGPHRRRARGEVAARRLHLRRASTTA